MVHNLLKDFSVVLKHADNVGLLEKSTIPAKFYEHNPHQIYTSYLEFQKTNPDSESVSITDKFSTSQYTSPYQIYHDIRLVASQEIVNHKVGSEAYKNTDFFYKFTTELLLRESERLGLLLFERQDVKESDETSRIFREDVQRISSCYFVDNGEVITYMNKIEEQVPSYHSLYTDLPQQTTHVTTQPLFSSLVGKSAVDPRQTIVPDPYNLAKVISPPKTQDLGTGTFRAFNGSLQKPFSGGLENSQILERFFFPNWYTIEAPKWLQYKQKSLKPPVESTLVKETNTNELRTYEKGSQTVRSFGPDTDSRNAILADTLKNSVWFNQIGSEQVSKYRRAYFLSKESPSTKTSNEPADIEAEDEAHASSPEDQTSSPPPSLANEESTQEPKSDTIKIENLVRYNPEQIAVLEQIKKESEDISGSPGHLQKVISASLLKLNKLRQERFSQNSLLGSQRAPSIEERVLYKKVVKLLTILLKSNPLQDCELAYEISRKLPVLANDYPGTLPGPVPTKVPTAVKTNRLSGLRGTHRRRGRLG